MKNRIWLSVICFLSAVPMVFSQPIELRNASFEDAPRHSTTPYGWYDCGQTEETPPDIQPGEFEVFQKAADGKTYLGLVTRDNDTWEGVGQRLTQPMQAGVCYTFSISLARAENYISISKTTRVEENFNKPIRLRIWGGTSYCSKKEKLAETITIKNTSWKEYSFKLNPKGNYNYIFLEAFFEPTLFPYNGNILVDECSALVPCDKKTEKPIAENPKPEIPLKPKPKTQEKPRQETGATTSLEPVAPKKKVITPELDRSKITRGTVIQVNNLYFKADSFNFQDNSIASLQEVYDFLAENPDVQIEIGGHTNNVPSNDYCDRLSTSRAKSVVDFLVKKGIGEDRLSYKGYGKRFPVVSNDTRVGRAKNQRVEIKIMNFKG
jgi:outer membrane protein OmpA-like peptidoglycan-associated protein